MYIPNSRQTLSIASLAMIITIAFLVASDIEKFLVSFILGGFIFVFPVVIVCISILVADLLKPETPDSLSSKSLFEKIMLMAAIAGTALIILWLLTNIMLDGNYFITSSIVFLVLLFAGVMRSRPSSVNTMVTKV